MNLLDAADSSSTVAVPVLVAVIVLVGTLGAPIVTGIMQRRVQRQNRADHNDVQTLAQQVHDRLIEVGESVARVDKRVGRVESQITSHVKWEMEQKHMTADEVRDAIDQAIAATRKPVPTTVPPDFPHQGETS